MEGEFRGYGELPNRVHCFWSLNLAAPDRLLNVDEALLQVYVFDSQTTQFSSPHSGFGCQPVEGFQWPTGRSDYALDFSQREEDPRLPHNLWKHKSFKWIVGFEPELMPRPYILECENCGWQKQQEE